MRVTGLFLMLFAGSLTLSAQLCTVGGQVVDKVTGAPIRKVALTLSGAGGRAMGPMQGGRGGFAMMQGPGGRGGVGADQAVYSDAEGRFRFEGLAPGSYRLVGDKVGYIRQEFNPRGVSFTGTRLECGEGEQLTGLVFKLSPQGVITGRALDDDGDPRVGVRVALLGESYDNGQRQFEAVAMASSNDIGEFRIAQVEPGRYYLMATDNQRGTDMLLESAPFVSTYYPHAVDMTAASPVTVREGQQLSGIDIRLQRARVFSVRGVVVDSVTNTAGARVNLMMSQQGSQPMAMFQRLNTRSDDNGIFEFGSVLPGTYAITTSGRGRGGRGGRGGASSEGVAYQSIVVGSGDLDNVVVRLQPPLQLTGNVVVEDSPDADVTRVRIDLVPETDIPQARNQGRVGDDGSFELTDLAPDRYALNFTSLPPGMYPKRARYGDANVLNSLMDLSGGVAAPLQITLSPKAASVSGTVTDSNDDPAAGVVVTLLPEGEGFHPDYLYQTVRTDLDGNFQMQGITPGDYNIYAWEDLESGAERNPEFLSQFADFRAEISVDESESETVRMGMIPMSLVTAAR